MGFVAYFISVADVKYVVLLSFWSMSEVCSFGSDVDDKLFYLSVTSFVSCESSFFSTEVSSFEFAFLDLADFSA